MTDAGMATFLHDPNRAIDRVDRDRSRSKDGLFGWIEGMPTALLHAIVGVKAAVLDLRIASPP